MRSMMLLVVLVAGCSCLNKNNDLPPNCTIIYPGPRRIVETLPPPELYQDRDLPPAGPPIPLNAVPVPAMPTGRVKVIEVRPIRIYPPLPPDLPEWQEPKIIIPKDGNPVLRAKVVKTNLKLIMTENPPYNGPPNVGWEICWNW